MKTIWNLLSQTVTEWNQDQATVLAAALAYYTIFALAPTLIIVVAVAGLVFGQGEAQQALLDQVAAAVGSDVAGVLGTLLQNTAQSGSGILATVIGVALLIFGATGLFAQLQNALNRVWGVKPDPSAGIMNMLRTRVLSLGMVLVIGFLLLVSLLLSAALNVVNNYFSNLLLLPGEETFWQVMNFALSTAVITLLFAMIFKYLPDVQVAWRDVWVGALVTSLLFSLGKFLISYYIGTSSAASTYGAAGSLVVLLLWIYYSAQILLFGAEFTQVYGRRFGSGIKPAEYAVRSEAANKEERVTSNE